MKGQSFTVDILSKKQQQQYPIHLLKRISDDEIEEHEKTKLQYLLEHWVLSYKKMGDVQKSKYINSLKTILNQMYSAYVITQKLDKAVTLMYYEEFKQWDDMTSYISVGLKNSQLTQLKILWKMSFNLLQIQDPIKQVKYGEHLSKNFEECLRKYTWKSHQQKIYLLQLMKHINHRSQYNQFLINGKAWVNKMKKMLDEGFKSQIKDSKGISVTEYEYKLQMQEKAKNQDKESIRSRYDSVSSTESHSPSKAEGYEITPFFVVKDIEQQKQTYEIQLKSEIIEARSLIWLIDEQFWIKNVQEFLLVFQDSIIGANKSNSIDMMRIKTFEKILNSDTGIKIIQEKYLQKIVIKIIQNKKYSSSPFRESRGKKILEILNEISLQRDGDTETIMQERIAQIIKQGNQGKDDIVSRSLMDISSNYPMQIKYKYLKMIEDVLTNSEKKSIVPLETYQILAKVFLNGIQGQRKYEFNVYKLCVQFPKIIEHFQEEHQKKKELRKLSIHILYELLQYTKMEYDVEEIVVQAVFQWLADIQTNSKKYDIDMLRLLFLILKIKRRVVKNMNWENYERIMAGQALKLSQSPYRKYTYSYLNCLTEAGYRYNIESSYEILKNLNPECFRQERRIYSRQAHLILLQFKKKNKKKLSPTNKDKKRKHIPSFMKPSIKSEEKGIKVNDQQEEQKQKILEDQKKIKEEFDFYFSQEKYNFQGMLDHYGLYTGESKFMEEFELVFFQYLSLKYLLAVEEIYQLRNWEDEHFCAWLKSYDERILKLFQRLAKVNKYKEMYIFASKIFFICRNYYFVTFLQSFKFLKQTCFGILSIHFNRVQILSAASCFCSLLIPYRNSSRLKQIYDELNQEQFLTDLFKGVNQFISQQTHFYPQVIIILQAYWMTIPFREHSKYLQSCLIYLHKNVLWWSDYSYNLNPYIPILEDSEEKEQIDVQDMDLILPSFRETLTELLRNYYSEIIRKDIEKRIGETIE